MKYIPVYQWTDIPRFVSLALIYVVLAHLVLTFSSENGHVTIFWLPGGIGLAALLLWGKRYFLAIFFGALAAGLEVGDPLPLSITIAIGNTLESLCAAYLLTRISGFNLALIQISDFLTLTWVACLSSVISALVGPFALWQAGVLVSGSIVDSILHWWQADTLGILLGTPLLLVWRNWPTSWFNSSTILTTILFFSGTFLAGQIIFLHWFHEYIGAVAMGYWMFLFVVAAAVFYGRHGALLLVSTTAIQALFGALHHIGYFAHDFEQTQLENFWFYLLVLTIVGIALAINIEARNKSACDLEDSETRFRLFLNHNPLIAWIKDDAGRYVYFNQRFTERFSATPDTWYGKNDNQLWPTAIAEQFRANDTSVLSNWQSKELTEETVDEHGESTHWMIVKFPILDSNGLKFVGGIGMDISQRRLQELQVQRITKMYAALAQTNRTARQAKTERELFDTICQIAVNEGEMQMVWLGTRNTDSDFIQVMASFGDHLNYLDSLSTSKTIPVLPMDINPTGKALLNGQAFIIQDLSSSPDVVAGPIQDQNNMHWCSCAAFPIYRANKPYAVLTLYHHAKNAFDALIVDLLNGMVKDIGFALDVMDTETDKENTLVKLRRSEMRFRAIFEQAAVGLAQIDSMTGYFSWANPRYCEIVGLSSEALLKTTFMALTHPDDVVAEIANMHLLQHGLTRSFTHEVRYLRPNQPPVWVSLTVSPLWQAGDKPDFHIAVIEDISNRKKAEEKLRLNANVFETTLEGIMITNLDKIIIDVNLAFTKITGYSRAEILGKHSSILKSSHHDASFFKEMWRMIRTTGHWSGEVWNKHKDGQLYPEWLSISAITDDSGKVTHYVGISADISVLKQHEKQLEYIAHYDALTGIPNRVLLLDRMKQALSQSKREQKLLAICYLDLDGFKPINDALGHEEGDKVLIEIAHRMSQSLRGGDTVARLGGDEFIILLLNIDSFSECIHSLDRLLAIIAKPLILQDNLYSVTASIGVTLYPQDEEEPDTLMRHADQAMYIAKQMGKNRYHIYDPHHDITLKLHHEHRIRVGLGILAKEFELFYQPKVNLHTKEISGFEALIRWRVPEQGILLPDEFLPDLENSDLEIQIGDWVIEGALTQIEEWLAQDIDLNVSINIAASHLQSENFVNNLHKHLENHPKVRGDQLQIEILETVALADISSVAKIIEGCSDLGVKFALDDFGTGYSSLSYLRRLPADTLKIDQSFIRNMLVDHEDRAIVQGVIALARTFNRITVAEGVETIQHFQALREMNCDIGQGYGIARPMPASEVLHWCQAFYSEHHQYDN